MAKNTETKTNAIRTVEASGLPHVVRLFEATGEMTGTQIALSQGQDPDVVFKTLVTVGKTGQHYVFVVPVNQTLSLKKAASAVGEKSIQMIKSRELLPLTGYIHGGCSPIGMKRLFPTVVDEIAQLYDVICFSGGRIGSQIEIAPEDLGKIIPIDFADITE